MNLKKDEEEYARISMTLVVDKILGGEEVAPRPTMNCWTLQQLLNPRREKGGLTQAIDPHYSFREEASKKEI